MLLVDIGCVDDFTAAVFGGRDCVAIVDCSPLQATPRGSVGPASSISTVKDSGSVSLCGGRSDGIAHGRWSRGSLRDGRRLPKDACLLGMERSLVRTERHDR